MDPTAQCRSRSAVFSVRRGAPFFEPRRGGQHYISRKCADGYHKSISPRDRLLTTASVLQVLLSPLSPSVPPPSSDGVRLEPVQALPPAPGQHARALLRRGARVLRECSVPFSSLLGYVLLVLSYYVRLCRILSYIVVCVSAAQVVLSSIPSPPYAALPPPPAGRCCPGRSPEAVGAPARGRGDGGAFFLSLFLLIF